MDVGWGVWSVCCASRMCKNLNCLVVSTSPAVLLRPWKRILLSSAESSFSEARRVILVLPTMEVITISSDSDSEEALSVVEFSSDRSSWSRYDIRVASSDVRGRFVRGWEWNIRWVETGEETTELLVADSNVLERNGIKIGWRLWGAKDGFWVSFEQDLSSSLFQEFLITGGPSSSEKSTSGRSYNEDRFTMNKWCRCQDKPFWVLPPVLPTCPPSQLYSYIKP